MAASLVCAALAGWLGLNAIKTFREQRALIHAEKFVNEPEQYSKLLKAAYAIDPKNPNTPYWIGSSLRHQSWNGAPGYEKLATEAIAWFEKAIALDPYAPHPHIGIGMCLHWLGRSNETWPHFRHARVLDANNYWVYATYGWHLMQFGAWLPAAEAFAMSKGLKPTDNPMAETYFKFAMKKIEEQKQPPQISEPAPAATTTNAPATEK